MNRVLLATLCFFGTLLSVFADPFIDIVRDDIQKTYPKHIDRFTKLVPLSLYDSTKYDVVADTLRILLGKYGLRKTRSENYNKQLDYAHEFIGRLTNDRYQGDMASNGTNHFLADIAQTLEEIPCYNKQHVSFTILYSILSSYDIGRTLLNHMSERSYWDLINDPKSYMELGKYAEIFHQYITKEKFKTEADLLKHMNDSRYRHNRQPFLDYMKWHNVATESEKVVLPYATVGIEKAGVVIKFPQMPIFTQGYNAYVKGNVKGVSADGTCYYHTIKEGLLYADPFLKAKSSRKAVVDVINQKLDDPFVRYTLSKEIPEHVTGQLVYGKHLLKDIASKINQEKEYENAEKQKKAGDALPMNQFLYRKDVCQKFLELCFGKKDWIANKSAIHGLWPYLFEQSTFIFLYNPDLNTVLWHVFRLTPSQKVPFVIIFHTDHFYYMQNVHVTFEKAH